MNLLALEGMDRKTIESLLDEAERLADVASGVKPRLNTLAGKTIANMFFEDSTRTRCSFTLAARRLGADVLEFTAEGSSVSKGETLFDTALTIEAMGVNAIVVRTAASGGAGLVARAVGCSVINAGDGKHEHPTQGLLDALTLRQRLGSLDGRAIAIVGDIAASRVARSAIHGLTTLGMHVRLIGPPTLVPRSLERIVADQARGMVEVSHDLDAAIESVDAVMMLRVQFERGSDIPSDYRQHYAMTAARADRLQPHAVVMHPGPMNRGIEIDGEVADNKTRSAILQQVTNGVAIRMAALARV